MNRIDIITDSPFQTMLLHLDTGDNIKLTLRYSYNQQGWFFDMESPYINIFGRRMTTSLNLLRAFRNILPFGLAVTVNDLHEPVFIDDFKNGRSILYTLNQSDAQQVEQFMEAP